MRLDELAAQVDLPPTMAAERAWAAARRRRTQRVAAGTATVAAAVAIGLVAVLAPSADHGAGPSPATSSHSATGTPTSAASLPAPPPLDPAVVMPALGQTDLLDLVGRAPVLAPHDLTELSTDPVGHAVLAVAPMGITAPEAFTTVDVLGDDGRWRHVDVPGLRATDDGSGYHGYALDVTGLNADGTRLAVPQPDGLVVVDLTTGRSRRYDVTGPWRTVRWQDDDHVVLLREGRADARVVDLATGGVASSDVTTRTRFLADGSSVRWGSPGDPRTPRSTETVITSGDGSTLATVGNDEGGLEQAAPLVDASVVVGVANLLDLDHTQRSGPVVVDRATGAVLGVWPVSDADLANAQLLSLDDTTVLVALPAGDSQVVVVRWDWAARTLDPVFTVAAPVVAAGPGVACLPGCG